MNIFKILIKLLSFFTFTIIGMEEDKSNLPTKTEFTYQIDEIDAKTMLEEIITDDKTIDTEKLEIYNKKLTTIKGENKYMQNIIYCMSYIKFKVEDESKPYSNAVKIGRIEKISSDCFLILIELCLKNYNNVIQNVFNYILYIIEKNTDYYKSYFKSKNFCKKYYKILKQYTYLKQNNNKFYNTILCSYINILREKLLIEEGNLLFLNKTLIKFILETEYSESIKPIKEFNENQIMPLDIFLLYYQIEKPYITTNITASKFFYLSEKTKSSLSKLIAYYIIYIQPEVKELVNLIQYIKKTINEKVKIEEIIFQEIEVILEPFEQLDQAEKFDTELQIYLKKEIQSIKNFLTKINFNNNYLIDDIMEIDDDNQISNEYISELNHQQNTEHNFISKINLISNQYSDKIDESENMHKKSLQKLEDDYQNWKCQYCKKLNKKLHNITIKETVINNFIEPIEGIIFQSKKYELFKSLIDAIVEIPLIKLTNEDIAPEVTACIRLEEIEEMNPFKTIEESYIQKINNIKSNNIGDYETSVSNFTNDMDKKSSEINKKNSERYDLEIKTKNDEIAQRKIAQKKYMNETLNKLEKAKEDIIEKKNTKNYLRQQININALNEVHKILEKLNNIVSEKKYYTDPEITITKEESEYLYRIMEYNFYNKNSTQLIEHIITKILQNNLFFEFLSIEEKYKIKTYKILKDWYPNLYTFERCPKSIFKEIVKYRLKEGNDISERLLNFIKIYKWELFQIETIIREVLEEPKTFYNLDELENNNDIKKKFNACKNFYKMMLNNNKNTIDTILLKLIYNFYKNCQCNKKDTNQIAELCTSEIIAIKPNNVNWINFFNQIQKSISCHMIYEYELWIPILENDECDDLCNWIKQEKKCFEIYLQKNPQHHKNFFNIVNSIKNTNQQNTLKELFYKKEEIIKKKLPKKQNLNQEKEEISNIKNQEKTKEKNLNFEKIIPKIIINNDEMHKYTEEIKKWTPEHIKQLNKKGIELLHSMQISWISEECIKELTIEQLDYFNDNIVHFTAIQRKALPNCSLNQTQVNLLKTNEKKHIIALGVESAISIIALFDEIKYFKNNQKLKNFINFIHSKVNKINFINIKKEIFINVVFGFIGFSAIQLIKNYIDNTKLEKRLLIK